MSSASCRVSTGPKIHDLEWPFYVKFSLLRLRFGILSRFYWPQNT